MSLEPLGGLCHHLCPPAPFNSLHCKQGDLSQIQSDSSKPLYPVEESKLFTLTSKVLCDGATLTLTSPQPCLVRYPPALWWKEERPPPNPYDLSAVLP